MKNLITFLTIVLGFLSQNAWAQQTVKISEASSSSSPILIDGMFSKDEWQDARTVKVNDSVTLLFKQFKGHVFIGVKTDTPYPAYVDMFLQTENNELYNLHASMQIGERRLTGDSWTDREPAWRWGNHVGWIANESKYDQTKDRSLPDKEKVFPFEGREFQLLRSRFAGKIWKLRVEVRGSTEDVVYPVNSQRTETASWLILRL